MQGNRLPFLDVLRTGSILSSGHNFGSRRTRFGGWQATWLAAVLSAGFALPADAQVYWPMDPGSSVYAEPPQFEPPRPRVARARQKLPDAPKETAKPVGPITIAISIENQTLKLYDQNGLFAESPVSTGMRGHSTPMGVFSVIQKNKYHRSNIYSGAPMPYMQRITWSGVAMHAGVLPGYPASHGCIRMPMNFAMRMWGWTRMGARVVIAPGEVSPSDISHPLLIARKPEIRPVAATTTPDKHAETTPKSDRSSIVEAAAHEKPQLRLTSMSEGEPIRTADASGALPQKSDAGDVVVAQRWDAGRDGSPAPEEKTEGVKDGATPPKDGASSDGANKDDATKTDGSNAGASGDKPADAKSDDKKSEAPKETLTETPKEASAETPKNDKDQARATDPVAPANVTPLLEGSAEFVGPVKPRSGHLAVLVSRKENKIFVRQNFEPWFEAPVTIAASDRPLGTHVFTVRADKADADALRWSVVSLPAPMHMEEAPRRKRGEAPVVTAPAQPSSPKEALDRLTIPEETMQRIASAIAPGGSITVSDRGLGDETGRGTDFIVPLR